MKEEHISTLTYKVRPEFISFVGVQGAPINTGIERRHKKRLRCMIANAWQRK